MTFQFHVNAPTLVENLKLLFNLLLLKSKHMASTFAENLKLAFQSSSKSLSSTETVKSLVDKSTRYWYRLLTPLLTWTLWVNVKTVAVQISAFSSASYYLCTLFFFFTDCDLTPDWPGNGFFFLKVYALLPFLTSMDGLGKTSSLLSSLPFSTGTHSP